MCVSHRCQDGKVTENHRGEEATEPEAAWWGWWSWALPRPVLSQAVHGSPAPELLSEEHVRWPASLWLLAVSEASVCSKPWAQMRSTVQQNATTLSGAQGSLKWERWCRDPKVT